MDAAWNGFYQKLVARMSKPDEKSVASISPETHPECVKSWEEILQENPHLAHYAPPGTQITSGLGRIDPALYDSYGIKTGACGHAWARQDDCPFCAKDKMPAWGVPGETPQEGEWPARDRVPFVTMDEFHEKTGHRFAAPIGLRPADVTPEMVDAADAAFEPYGSLAELVKFPALCAIYRAMHAAAPMPLVSDAEIALTRERDEAWVASRMAAIRESADFHTMRMERDEARAAHNRAMDLAITECEKYNRACRENTTLRAELMAAHDRLAKFTDQNAPAPEAPDPIANAIRPREMDRWRVGG